jgi:hypothetical protein
MLNYGRYREEEEEYKKRERGGGRAREVLNLLFHILSYSPCLVSYILDSLSAISCRPAQYFLGIRKIIAKKNLRLHIIDE